MTSNSVSNDSKDVKIQLTIIPPVVKEIPVANIIDVPSFKWDGTYLGSYTLKIITKEIAISGSTDIIWHIKCPVEIANGSTVSALPELNSIIVQAKTTKGSFSCIVDELKPLFGLIKRGTHTIHVNKKLFLIFRPTASQKTNSCLPSQKTNNNKEVEYLAERDVREVEDLECDSIFRQQVRAIYVFRYLVGVTMSVDRCIKIQERKYGRCNPVGALEVTCCLDVPNRKLLPATVLKKWFTKEQVVHGRWDTEPDNIFTGAVSRLVRCCNEEHLTLPQRIAKFRKSIGEVINRVDKSWTWILSFIIDRISNELSNISMCDPKFKL